MLRRIKRHAASLKVRPETALYGRCLAYQDTEIKGVRFPLQAAIGESREELAECGCVSMMQVTKRVSRNSALDHDRNWNTQFPASVLKSVTCSFELAQSRKRACPRLFGIYGRALRQVKSLIHHGLLCVATPTGLEPVTTSVTGLYSNQLNYGAKMVGRLGLEPRANRLKGDCSNQLS